MIAQGPTPLYQSRACSSSSIAADLLARSVTGSAAVCRTTTTRSDEMMKWIHYRSCTENTKFHYNLKHSLKLNVILPLILRLRMRKTKKAISCSWMRKQFPDMKIEKKNNCPIRKKQSPKSWKNGKQHNRKFKTPKLTDVMSSVSNEASGTANCGSLIADVDWSARSVVEPPAAPVSTKRCRSTLRRSVSATFPSADDAKLWIKALNNWQQNVAIV